MALISRAEAFDQVYKAFSQINFTAFDYETIKESVIDYLKLYYPESFNDFIESSEYVALIEIFAYIGELLIYRVDVSSHENFIQVAQRKQSVLRLAKLISYRASRNIPARGMLKITSVQSTEELYDTRGTALKGRTVTWNDVNNLLWKEQFLTIINGAMITQFGSVLPNDRVQVDNVLFELYSLNNTAPTRGVYTYSAQVDGTAYPMEVVPVLLDQYGPAERRPENGASFTFTYASDGYGNDSPTTGFLLFTKQGTLRSTRQTFDGKTPNQYWDITVNNINDTDLWVNQIDATTEQIVDDGSIRSKRSGEWEEVDTTSAQNVIFSYSSNKNRYETETLENDQVRIAFGDGEFATIPSGLFEAWYRVSANADLVIPRNAVVDQQFSISYTDKLGQAQTLTITASLISNLQNASESEDIEHIRRVAPAAYYAQDRMVNGADYNNFPLKDTSILKLRSINRTYAGESKFSHWHDASGTYENIKIVGDDMTLMLDQYTDLYRVDTGVSTDTLFNNTILPILSTTGFYSYQFTQNVSTIRRSMTDNEQTQIKQLLLNNVWTSPIFILYDASVDLYYASTTDNATQHLMTINATVAANKVVGWTVSSNAAKLMVESDTTMFWEGAGNQIIAYDTLTPQRDRITLLKANLDKYGTNVLPANISLAVQNVVAEDVSGLPNINRLEVVAYDSVNNSISGINMLGNVLDPVYQVWKDTNGVTQVAQTAPSSVPQLGLYPLELFLPSEFAYVKGMGEIQFVGLNSTQWSEDPNVPAGTLTRYVYINDSNLHFPFQMRVKSFVYNYRAALSDDFAYIATSEAVRLAYAQEYLAGTETVAAKYKRMSGRANLNFMWIHRTDQYHLVDPSPTNIIDSFIIQKGYYSNFRGWLLGNNVEPVAPTALQLRSDYKDLLVNAMISDSMIFHPGKLKLIFGDKSSSQLRAQILVVKNTNTKLTDSQIKVKVRDVVRDFFDISEWEFGETFYFTQLNTVIHQELGNDINSVVLVPLYPNHYFGDMFQVNMNEDEIVQADIDIEDIAVTTALNAVNINQFR